jgi:multiple sugar transport system permease protein
MMPPTSGALWRSLLLHSFIIAAAIVFLTPLFWTMATSLKTQNEFAVDPIGLPKNPTLTNFEHAFIADKPDWMNKFRFPIYVLNTLVITQLVVLGTVLSSSLVAYGFARFKFPGRNILFAMLISTMLLPPQVTMVPVFMIWNKLGLVNTIFPLILPAFFASSAFSVFLLRQFYMQLPRSLDEAAMIDGCTPFGIWWRIMMPLSKPALITVGLFAFTAAWEDFMSPFIYLHDQRNYTVSIGLRLYNDEFGASNLPQLMAASLLHIAPVVILFFIAQKYFVRGIATSGLKD